MSDTHLTPDEIEAQIEEQRAHLADTVDQLTYKLDVKRQARERLDSVRSRPEVIGAFVAAAVAAGALVWWSKRR